MEALNNRRLRLRHELQAAYDAWMDATVLQGRGRHAGAAPPQWFDYLAAKQRLVLAYADMAPAG
jgi:hypothetical protein